MGCADTEAMTQSPKRATHHGLSRAHTEHEGLSIFVAMKLDSDAGHNLLYHTLFYKRYALKVAISLSAEL